MLQKTSGAKNDQEIKPRVSRLEGAVESLAEDLHELTQLVTTQTREHQRQYEDIADRLGNVGRPNWPAMIAAGTFIVLILSLVGAMGLAPLYFSTGSLTVQLNELKTAQLEHEKLLATELKQKMADLVVYRDEVVRRLDQRIAYEREVAELKARLLSKEK